MAKREKESVAKKPVEPGNKQLVDAIVTVKQLQAFIKDRGGLAAALENVNRVRQLVQLTGGFDPLTQALEIVGQEPGPAAEGA
jgi:hypothetical protein